MFNTSNILTLIIQDDRKYRALQLLHRKINSVLKLKHLSAGNDFQTDPIFMKSAELVTLGYVVQVQQNLYVLQSVPKGYTTNSWGACYL